MTQIVPTKIVVIHDDIFDEENNTSPIMVSLKMKYGNSNVILFRHSREGLDYVLENLGQKMVVLLDRNFYDGKEMDGIEVFEKIREETSLVYVILVTVSKISEIDGEVLKKLINKDLFKLESFTADYSKIINLIDEAVQILDVRVDAVIEDWIVRHPPEKREQVILKTKEGRTYTMNEILESIRKQTSVGITFEKNLLKLAIELFSRQKLKIDD
jgi:CheY-like chemotaxis protein